MGWLLEVSTTALLGTSQRLEVGRETKQQVLIRPLVVGIPTRLSYLIALSQEVNQIRLMDMLQLFPVVSKMKLVTAARLSVVDSTTRQADCMPL